MPEIAQCAGLMCGNFRTKGVSRSQADILIAATAEVHDLILVTLNTRDFEGCNIQILNPFIE
jgi:predicted nucleic acid-binding protein